MSQARRQFFRVTLITASLMASGLAMAQASIDPKLNALMRKAKPTDGLQVIVSFKQSGPASTQQIAALRALGITNGRYMRRLPIMGVVATAAQVRELAKRTDVVSLYYNAPLRYFNLEARQMSGAERVEKNPMDYGRILPYSGRGVTVVVNDSGIDTTHPDLPAGTKVVDNVFAPQNNAANVANGNNGSGPAPGIIPYTVVRGLPNTDLGSGHGNHCAGTVAGTGAASGGKYKGAAPGADLVGYGSGGVLLILDAVGGLDFSLSNQFSYRNPIRTVSNSWGSSGKFDPKNPVSIATYELYKRGIVSVFAAGNDGPGEDTHNPYAQAPWVISVGAGEKDGVLTGFSSRGNRGEKGTFTMPDGKEFTYVNEPTIVATGVDIISTRTVTGGVLATSAPQDAGLEPAHVPYYSHLSGTSMATPHVAGITALMFEANPNLTPDEVKEILKATATNMSGRRSFEVGAGHVNAYAAVAEAAARAKGTTLGFGSTLKIKRNFRVGTVAGAVDNLFRQPDTIYLPGGATPTEFSFPVGQGYTEVTGRVDTYSAPNGTGTSYVRAELVDPNGKVYTGPTTLPGAFLLGPVSSVTAPAIPGTWKIRIKGAQVAQVFTPEEMQVSVTGRRAGTTGYNGPEDVLSMPAAQREMVEAALAAELVDADPGEGKGTNDNSGVFNPTRNITRADFARYLAFAGNIRQSLDFKADAPSKFTDLSKEDPLYGFAAAVSAPGGVLRDLKYTQNAVMLPRGTFDGGSNLTRTELAYGLVQALGDQSVTDAVVPTLVNGKLVINGKPVEDTAIIPPAMRKHVVRAVTLGFLTLTERNGVFRFSPSAPVTKLAYTEAILKYNAEYRKVED